jgi:acyl-[acyl-carrier-protein]-phospholipid O-acyltransferase/long-chain-fatty-acid--[acyl-carrier-protein] ligase
LENADACEALFRTTSDDCMLGVLPFFHSFGYTFGLWFPVLEGFRAAYHSTPTDARIVGDLAMRERATFMLSTPTFAQQYARRIEREQFASLKYVLVGAEKLRDSVAAEFRQHFGFDLLAGYGCTELGPGVSINRPDVTVDGVLHTGTRNGSVGRPLRGIAVRIAHPESGAILRNGEQGLVCVKGPSQMAGYYEDPALTSTAIQDGFYVTGDLGYVDDDGFLYITDRLARFSKVAGEMVPHLRIEEAISDLVQSFATGVPDNNRGERLVLLIIEGAATATEVHTRLSDLLPPLWVPKRENIFPVSAIPTLASGKVDLSRARAMASSLCSG